MAFIGFDLDETLGRFVGPFYHLLFLMPWVTYSTSNKGLEPFPLPDDVRKKLDIAFQTFVTCVAANETTQKVLRPGILKIMKKLSELKDQGQVSAISVYSNNGSLACLLFATALIEELLGKKNLFCNHIDWYNPLRSKEITPGHPGVAFKTVETLQKSFLDSKCGPYKTLQDIPAAKVYFFDDIIHSNILARIGNERYFLVNSYKVDVPSKEFHTCFDTAMKFAQLTTDEEYLNYIAPFLSQYKLPAVFESIQTYMDEADKSTVWKNERFYDDTEDILARIDSMLSLKSYGNNYFPVTDGGRRRKGRRVTVKRRTKARKTRYRRHHKKLTRRRGSH